jgi:hypothetical protein
MAAFRRTSASRFFLKSEDSFTAYFAGDWRADREQ